jgi:hypothetical protein
MLGGSEKIKFKEDEKFPIFFTVKLYVLIIINKLQASLDMNKNSFKKLTDINT